MIIAVSRLSRRCGNAALGNAVADFTLATDAQRILESMVDLVFVEADLGKPLHVGVV